MSSPLQLVSINKLPLLPKFSYRILRQYRNKRFKFNTFVSKDRYKISPQGSRYCIAISWNANVLNNLRNGYVYAPKLLSKIDSNAIVFISRHIFGSRTVFLIETVISYRFSCSANQIFVYFRFFSSRMKLFKSLQTEFFSSVRFSVSTHFLCNIDCGVQWPNKNKCFFSGNSIKTF